MTFPLVLNNAFREAFYKYKNQYALHFNNESVTYNELRIRSNRVAHAIKNLQLPENSRIALLMSNRLEYVYCQQGIYQTGHANVPLNDMLGENEIKYILNDCKAKVLIVEQPFFSTLQNIKDELLHLELIVGISDVDKYPIEFISWDDFQGSQSEDDVVKNIDSFNIAQSVYTGGTTGNPKGVLHSYDTSMATLFMVMLENEVLSDERILLTSPLPHASGLSLQAGLLRGAEIFIEKKFSEELVLNHIEKNKITYFMAVPTMIYRIIDFMEGKSFDISSLRTIVYGTAPITQPRLEQALSIFGPIFIQTYGLTETPGAATKLSKENHIVSAKNAKRLTSCGRPTVLTQVKIIGNDGNELPPESEGEIIILSPVNMVGYNNMPEVTEQTLVNGWLHTGDIGYIDNEGFIYVLDRKKDMIISGGMNVYSTEVESELQKHPDVLQVAVIGIPHDDWGEAVTAFVIPKNKNLTIENLEQWSKANLSKYKVPKIFKIVSSLPLTPYGKVDKKNLKKPYWDSLVRRI